MLRYLGQPFEAGGLHGCVGIEAARHGAMDDGLLLFVQEFDQPLLGADEAAEFGCLYSKEAAECYLLIWRWDRQLCTAQSNVVNVLPLSNPSYEKRQGGNKSRRFKEELKKVLTSVGARR